MCEFTWWFATWLKTGNTDGIENVFLLQKSLVICGLLAKGWKGLKRSQTWRKKYRIRISVCVWLFVSFANKIDQLFPAPRQRTKQQKWNVLAFYCSTPRKLRNVKKRRLKLDPVLLKWTTLVKGIEKEFAVQSQISLGCNPKNFCNDAYLINNVLWFLWPLV